MDDLLAQGRREDVVVTMLAELAGLTPEELALSRADPSWPGRVAAAHTVVREVRAVEAYRFEPGRFTFLAVPTLLLDGGERPPLTSSAVRDDPDPGRTCVGCGADTRRGTILVIIG